MRSNEEKKNIRDVISKREVVHQKNSCGQTYMKVIMHFVQQSQPLMMTHQKSFFLQKQILMQDILILLQNQIILRILRKVGSILLDISLSNIRRPFNNSQKKNIRGRINQYHRPFIPHLQKADLNRLTPFSGNTILLG